MDPYASQFNPSASYIAAAQDTSGSYYEHQDDSYYSYNEEQEAATKPGSYYPTYPVQVSDHDVPVSAIAFDSTYDAVYSATVTTASGSSSNKNQQQQRVSYLSTHYYEKQQPVLYSSTAGHPEASPLQLRSYYTTLFGTTTPGAGEQSHQHHHHQRPSSHRSHYYRPCFGTADPALPDRALASGVTNHQVGVTHLHALPAQEHVVSVSPAAVRVHTMGGLCVADHYDPHDETTFYTAAAVLKNNNTSSSTHVVTSTSTNTLQTLDIWQGLRPVASTTLPIMGNTTESTSILTTDICTTTNNSNSILVGRSDGHVLVYDHRCRSCVARVVSPHKGGVVAVTAESQYMATTGYSSSNNTKTKNYPDPSVAMYDVRYWGRGGFPHLFAGLQGGPRHIRFAGQRLLVASGQVGGGCQILTPFAEQQTEFLVPALLGHGEALTAMAVDGYDQLALGTSMGRVLLYRMAQYETYCREMREKNGAEPMGGIFVPSREAAGGSRRNPVSDGAAVLPEKKPLVIPPFAPVPPSVSIDASILLKATPGRDGGNVRAGATMEQRSVFGQIILTADPVVSALGDISDKSRTSFHTLASTPLVEQTKLQVVPDLLSKANYHHGEYSLSTSAIGVDLMADPSSAKKKKNRHPGSSKMKSPSTAIPNPNKFIYSNSLYKLVYTESLNRMKRLGRRSGRSRTATGSDDDEDEGLLSIPSRYGLCLRPTHKLAASYNHAEFNHTGLIPGYDYPLTMPNAFVSPILMVLYFFPEIRETALRYQQKSDGMLLSELGFLFHRIDTLARNALVFSADEGVTALTGLDAWAPSSFISCLTATPEAERFQILDGSPAAIDPPRRPEAFYRFLMYQLDNEIQKVTRPASSSSSASSGSLIDALCGTGFVSINEFVSGSGPPTKSTTRHLTIELSYEHFYSREYEKSKTKEPSFGDVLQFNLCRATRLRAWSQASKSYETIVQRKIVTSLPKVLSLSAACAGRKPETGLSLWRQSKQWLPEVLEVEMEETGNVVVREWVKDANGEHVWRECKGSSELPAAIAQEVTESTQPGVVRRRQYKLDSVVSLVRDDLDRNCPDDVRDFVGEEGCLGHHLLHARVSHSVRKRILQQQRTELKRFLSSERIEDVTDMTLLGLGSTEEGLRKRLAYTEERLEKLNNTDAESSTWVLVNGFLVTNATAEDAREFTHNFKEPSVIVYRAAEEHQETPKLRLEEKFHIPVDVLRATSLTRTPATPLPGVHQFPGPGDRIAFDAEFVAVAEEESMLTPSGSKVVLRETRHALARISLLDGRNGRVLLDNHILPQEPVTDYLTRFSGIVAADLDPQRSRHHLITATAAYWKLRYWLEERQCIFVGHGLLQDFWTANLAVAAAQIIDTVRIYHQPAQRFVSLRFVTNFVLQRDMQLDTHDSLEDAAAALELYRKAVELKKENGGDVFAKLLRDLYAYGQRTDWKLGVGDIIEE